MLNNDEDGGSPRWIAPTLTFSDPTPFWYPRKVTRLGACRDACAPQTRWWNGTCGELSVGT